MTKAALRRIVKEVRLHGLWTSDIDFEVWRVKPGATVSRLHWVTRSLSDRLLVEHTSRGFDYRGREGEPDDDSLEEWHTSIDSAASQLRGDEVIRLSCWSQVDESGEYELVDLMHVDLVTGTKLEVAPDRRGSSGHWTTVGVLPSAVGS